MGILFISGVTAASTHPAAHSKFGGDAGLFTKKQIMKLQLLFYFLISGFNLFSQQMFRYNQSDTLVERITTPFFVSQKLVWFDSSYVEKHKMGSSFKIGKVCEQFGCDGDFVTTGKSQAGWWLLENKIIVCYLTQISSTEFKSELKVWRYNHLTGRFVLIL